MTDTRYICVLKRAYFLEALGEAAYRQGSRRLRAGVGSERWAGFAETEAEMRRLLHDELRCVIGHWKPAGAATRSVRWLSSLAGLVSPSLLRVIIRRVLGKQRYRRWADEFRPYNPELWQALVEHERKQADYFERRDG